MVVGPDLGMGGGSSEWTRRFAVFHVAACTSMTAEGGVMYILSAVHSALWGMSNRNVCDVVSDPTWGHSFEILLRNCYHHAPDSRIWCKNSHTYRTTRRYYVEHNVE